MHGLQAMLFSNVVHLGITGKAPVTTHMQGVHAGTVFISLRHFGRLSRLQ